MKNRLVDTAPLHGDLAALVLRMILGGLFIYHGWQKIDGYDQILPMFKDVIGIGSQLSLNLVIFAEFFCGILVLLGCFTRLAVLPILFTMIIAYFVAHGQDAFGKKELPFVFMLLCLPVFILGSGRFSIDALLFKKQYLNTPGLMQKSRHITPVYK